MNLRLRWLPRSLVGRVFALYASALLLFVGGGLGLFYVYQFSLELENAQLRAETLVEVVLPAVADSAVIGDYDTIRRTLARSIHHSDFAHASFIDIKGGVIRAERSEPPDVPPPQWLAALTAARLYDTNFPVVVGGRDYGVLRMGFAPAHVASGLWRQARVALGLAALALTGGLLLIRLPLRRWLGNLDRIESIGEGMNVGRLEQASALGEDAPIEFQRTFDVISRVAANMQVQREQAAVTLGAITDAVFTLDADGRVVLTNPAAVAMAGLTPTNLRGRFVHDLLPAVFGDGKAGYAPWRQRRVALVGRDGRARVLDTTLSSITGPDGAPCGYVLACRDVSQQHALDLRLQEELRSREAALAALRGVLEGLLPGGQGSDGSGDIEAISRMISGLVQRLQEHGERLRAIFTLSPDGFVSFDAGCRISYVSPSFVQLTGLEPAALVGLDEAAFAACLAPHCADGRLPSFEVLRGFEGEGADRTQRRQLVEIERPARRVLQLTLRAGQGPVAQVLHLRDVTHETEVDRLKSDFLSTAAHELRTPMASVFGFIELMMHRPLAPEQQREVMTTVHRQSKLMIAILNELLDLSRIEARRGKDFKLERLDLGALVTRVVSDFKPPGERALPEMVLAGAPLPPVLVDRDKMAQALGNVLSNAYKYSPGGGAVHVVVTRAADGRLGVAVRDQGIGMTPAQLARVSERFWRADASGSIPGTGLGMSIVKEIIELLGGSMQVASEAGQGTQVTLWLPSAEAAVPPVDAEAVLA